MSEANRILKAIQTSSVTRVAFVDDAFDPPEIPESDWGGLLQYLSEPNAQDIRQAAEIAPEVWTAAIHGLNASSGEAAFELLQQLYAAYLRTFDQKFDPMGKFKTLKGPNLEYVKPLLSLIRKSAPNVTVTTYGTQMDAVEEQDGPDVVFVDLFLDPSISPTDTINTEKAHKAAQNSLARIQPLLKLSPSVILMSSHSGTTEAADYRKSIGGNNRVYASRFGFVEKKKFVEAGNEIQVDPEAGDVLLDMFQTHVFGRGLHQTLTAWVDCAQKAVKALENEIDGLVLADIAYLVRFRLATEGQSLSDYLEWLLGECLTDELGRQLDTALPESLLTKLGPEGIKGIDGAFDGPTAKVAALYHRVRFESKRVRAREHFRLGDLYLRTQEKKPDQLVAIMNPDCDLVKRPDDPKPAAHAMLTLGGSLEQFNAPSTSVGDFIVIDGKAQNIKWNYRAIETFPFEGAMSQAGQSIGEYRYLGALRPLYAQEIQANMLNRLGRVGVAVAPALAFASAVSVHYATTGGKLVQLKIAEEETPCYSIPARQSDQERLVLFRRPFVRQLIIALGKIDQSTLTKEAVAHLKELLTDAGRAKLSSLTADGLHLEKSVGHGVLLTAKKAKLSQQGPYWCCLAITMKTEEIPPSGQEEVEVAPSTTVQAQPEIDTLLKEPSAVASTTVTG